MFDKAIFMQYKYLISANIGLASDWWCSWMWGCPPPPPRDSLKNTCMTLLEVGGETHVEWQPRVSLPRPSTLLGGAQSPLGSSTLSQRINGN